MTEYGGNVVDQPWIAASMGSVGDCFDNAMCDSFSASRECELISRGRWPTPSEAPLQSLIAWKLSPMRAAATRGTVLLSQFARVDVRDLAEALNAREYARARFRGRWSPCC